MRRDVHSSNLQQYRYQSVNHMPYQSHYKNEEDFQNIDTNDQTDTNEQNDSNDKVNLYQPYIFPNGNGAIRGNTQILEERHRYRNARTNVKTDYDMNNNSYPQNRHQSFLLPDEKIVSGQIRGGIIRNTQTLQERHIFINVQRYTPFFDLRAENTRTIAPTNVAKYEKMGINSIASFSLMYRNGNYSNLSGINSNIHATLQRDTLSEKSAVQMFANENQKEMKSLARTNCQKCNDFNYNAMINTKFESKSHIYSHYNVNHCFPKWNGVSNDIASLPENATLNIIRTRVPAFANQDLMSETDFMDNYEDVILILDFPAYGGGCTAFLNYIISHFKDKGCTFLVVRNFSTTGTGGIVWYVNDRTIIRLPQDEGSANRFLDKIKNKIQKIFINSILGHSPKFIRKILDFDKKVTSVTHDLSLLYKEPQLYYHQLSSSQTASAINVQDIDCLVLQNEANMSVYGSKIKKTQEIVIEELPDYQKRLDKCSTNNSKTIIGIIGNIGTIKGSGLVLQLIRLVQENPNDLELVIFGRIGRTSYPRQYPYRDINELNGLLYQYKPNVLFETSIWTETYSYTLSLMMLTGLPIIYQKKTFDSTVGNRLAKYSNARPFDDIADVSVEMITLSKQNHFYTIEPVIYYPDFWSKYFVGQDIKSPNGFNIVFISSKIYTSAKPFNYVSNRSIYTPAQRFEQTLSTIASIRKYVPNNLIILLDNSQFSKDEYNQLNFLVDVFVNPLNNARLNYFTNESSVKMYGDIAQTRQTLHYIQTRLKSVKIANFFKISGRYVINDTFDFSQYDNRQNVFKLNDQSKTDNYYFTCFYKIGSANLAQFYTAIENIYRTMSVDEDQYKNYDIEVLLPEKLEYNFELSDNLGITQNIAVWNDRSMI